MKFISPMKIVLRLAVAGSALQPHMGALRWPMGTAGVRRPGTKCVKECEVQLSPFSDNKQPG